jgi:predicted transcriptional regulator
MRDTSLLAYKAIFGQLPSIRLKMFQAVIDCGGLTCEEMESSLGLKHQTASARLGELARAGLIRDSGKRRLTCSDNAAIVWVACDEPSQLEFDLCSGS